MMKSKLLLATAAMALFLTACSAQSEDDAKEESGNLLSSDWQEIAESAEGQEVNLYMWGGNDNINRYLDDWVAPRMKEEYDVKLSRVPVNDAQDIINQLLDEKTAGKTDGSMDIIWINGENFKAV